ncbi:MAG: Uncharacterised protein [Pseudidiomarina mangrovi]|nr:MAG: Uncharacterised protein [Pseudidiomarina mangrovi]
MGFKVRPQAYSGGGRSGLHGTDIGAGFVTVHQHRWASHLLQEWLHNWLHINPRISQYNHKGG